MSDINDIISGSQKTLGGDTIPLDQKLSGVQNELEGAKQTRENLLFYKQQLDMSRNALAKDGLVKTALDHVDNKDELSINTLEGQMAFSSKHVDKEDEDEQDLSLS